MTHPAQEPDEQTPGADLEAIVTALEAAPEDDEALTPSQRRRLREAERRYKLGQFVSAEEIRHRLG